MNRNMVSIIIPVYNVERYLRICLDSVMAQTFSDYEVILVDDGSTDGSPTICDEYVAIDSRFKVIHQENMGLASARNSGIRVAKGDYIYFIDSDDAIDSRLLEVAVDVAEWKQAGIVQINIKNVPEGYGIEDDALTSAIEGNDKPWRDKCQEFDIIDALYNLDKDDKSIAEDIRLTTTVVWTKLYRTSVFADGSLLFPEGMRMHEDQMVSHRNIARAGGMVFLNLPMYLYRQSNASLIRVGWTPKRLSILDCYEDRLSCVQEVSTQVNTSHGYELRDYMYKRTLVCMFRNYYMISKNMHGIEAREEKHKVIGRMRKLLKNKPAKLSFKDGLFYRAFVIIPGLFSAAFGIREKAKR